MVLLPHIWKTLLPFTFHLAVWGQVVHREGNSVTFSSHTKIYGERVFTIAALALLNAVPIDIRNSTNVALIQSTPKNTPI